MGSLKKSSNNFILYRGRYIRRLVHGRVRDQYVVSWSQWGSEREVFTGKLMDLINRIEDTDLFFGEWRYLI